MAKDIFTYQLSERTDKLTDLDFMIKQLQKYGVPSQIKIAPGGKYILFRPPPEKHRLLPRKETG
jgi:hypothetical protein